MSVIDFHAARAKRATSPRGRATVRQVPSGNRLIRLLDSWALSLDESGKSEKTIRSYTDSVRALCAYLTEHDLPADAEGVQADHLRAFLIAEKERTSAVSASVHYRNLNVFFGWIVREGERTGSPSPMANVDKPNVAKKTKEFFEEAELSRLLATCNGKRFEDRRDTAIMRILMDNGMRVSGLAGLRYDPDEDEKNDVFLARKQLRIRLKGGNELMVPIGKKAALALDRYLRARDKHSHASSPWLWLGTRGRGVAHMTDSGIRAMLKRRGVEAGIQNVHPHRFRRAFADQWLAGGGSVDDLMHITGWKTYDMVREYTEARGVTRARGAHAQYSPGDRI